MGKVVSLAWAVFLFSVAPAMAITWTESTLSGSDLGLHPRLLRSSSGMMICAYNQQGDHGSIGNPGSLRLWADSNTNGLCEVSEIQTIDSDGNTGLDISSIIQPDGTLTVAYHNDTSDQLLLWQDDDLDYAFDDGEIHIIDTNGRYPSIAYSATGHLAVSYQDTHNLHLKYWCDANGDSDVQPAEVSVIDTGLRTGYTPSLVFDVNGYAVTAYTDRNDHDLFLWHDSNGNSAADPGEATLIDSNGRTGQYPTVILSPTGKLILLYWNGDSDELLRWHDSNGNYVAETGEIETLSTDLSSAPKQDCQYLSTGNLAVSWNDSSVNGLRFWVDANDDLLTQPGELVVIEENQAVGMQSSIAPDDGNGICIAYTNQTHHDLHLWRDADTNGLASEAEISKIDRSGYNVGIQMSAAYDSEGLATLVYFESTDEQLLIWHDDNGDENPDENEIHTISSGYVQGNLDITFHPQTGNLLVLFYTNDQTLTAWHDDNGDFRVDEGEITIPDGSTGKICSTTYADDGILQTAYFVFPEYDLRFWEDRDGDYLIDEGESFLLDTDGDYVGQYMDIAMTPAGNVLVAYEVHYPYYDLRIWYDEDGDRLYDPGEIRVIDTPDRTGKYPSIVFDDQGLANILFYAADWYGSPGDLRYWVDADGDFELDAGEVETILGTSGDTGERVRMVLDGGYRPLAIFANSTDGTIEFWFDEDGNRMIGAGEYETLHGGFPAGEECGLAIRPWDQRVFAAWHDPVNRSLTVSFASLPDACIKGDINTDNVVSGDDAAGMAEVLLGLSSGWRPACAADMNSDGAENGLDLQLFMSATSH